MGRLISKVLETLGLAGRVNISKHCIKIYKKRFDKYVNINKISLTVISQMLKIKQRFRVSGILSNLSTKTTTGSPKRGLKGQVVFVKCKICSINQ